MSGWATSAAPASSPKPWTTLRTPGGSSASTAKSARSEHVSGAHSGGFRTAVQPAASAGPTFQVESMKGAFQGVISAATPDGSWRMRFSTPFASHVRPSRSSASWAKKRTLRAPRFMTRSREASRSEPLSSVSTAASVSTFSSIRSASRKRCSARPSGPRAAQAETPRAPPRRPRPLLGDHHGPRRREDARQSAKCPRTSPPTRPAHHR